MTQHTASEPAITSPVSDLSWVVVLVRSAGPTNVGLAARACANLGVDELRLVNPICDIDGKEARQFANKAGDLLESSRYDSVASAVADCDGVLASSARARDPAYGPPLPPEAIPSWTSQRGVTRCALLFGNEADGLSDPELRHAQALWRLATPGSYDNYNLSHAVALTLYNIFQATPPHSTSDLPPPLHAVITSSTSSRTCCCGRTVKPCCNIGWAASNGSNSS